MNLQQYLNDVPLEFKTFAVANNLIPDKPDTIKIVNKFPSFLRNFFLWNQGIAAITFNRTIFYFDELTEHTVLHELVHIKQYKELGIAGFLRKYLKEYRKLGYLNISLEKEAYEIAGDFLRRKGHVV